MLFTDIEGSTNALRALGSAYPDALARHRELVRESCSRFGGIEVDTQGDSFFVAFGGAHNAVSAAIETQRALLAEQWAAGEPLRVRMGIHTGEPELREDGYVGLDIHLAARICGVAHGGQVLVSRATRDLAGDKPDGGVTYRDLGDHRLKDFELPVRLFQIEAAGVPVDHPPPRTGSAVGLVVPTNRLVGREAELADVRELLERPDVHLVTLTGSGGTGKSRLALEFAWDAVERFEDGVFLVRLGQISDAELVPSAIAGALGVREPGRRPLLDAVIDHVRNRELLIVVDNFEHVLVAAPLLGLLSEAAPGLRLLATSRVPLRLRGEHVVDVEPLPQQDAMRLFVERARAVDRRFDDVGEAETVAKICLRLDGLPLAIELAAARVGVLSPVALLERLGLALLSGGGADLPERQRTLSATIDWSYQLLTPTQRELHAALGVFAGGSTLEAMEDVCGSATLLDDLAALVVGGLVRREDAGGDARFRMPQIVREYALERLVAQGRADELGARHARWVASMCEAAETELTGRDQAAWLERLEHELPNIRAALEWSLAAGSADLMLRIASSLGRFWRARGHMTEAREWLATGLATGDDLDPLLKAHALWAAAHQATAQGAGRASVPLLEEALTLYRQAGSTRDVVFTLAELGSVMQASGDLAAAERFGGEALTEARRDGDDRAVASALNELLAVATAQGDYERARSFGQEMLALRRRLGDPMLLANAANNVGSATLVAGDYAAAEEALCEALSIAIEVGDVIHTAAARCGLGEARLLAGDHGQATQLLAQSLEEYLGLAASGGCAECLTGLAGAASSAGDPKGAARYFGAAAAVRDATGGAPDAVEELVIDRFRPQAVDALGAEVFHALEEEGRSLEIADVLKEIRAPSLPGAFARQ